MSQTRIHYSLRLGNLLRAWDVPVRSDIYMHRGDRWKSCQGTEYQFVLACQSLNSILTKAAACGQACAHISCESCMGSFDGMCHRELLPGASLVHAMGINKYPN